MLAPNINRGMPYQTDGNHISKIIGYLVRVVKLACYSVKTLLYYDVSLSIIFYIFILLDIKNNRKMLRLSFLGHPGLHHTKH
jgi:hypothetical protein